MKLLITRHGESEANVLEIISNRGLPHGLTGKGIAQSQELAEKLSGCDVEAIFCSPIQRARETAEIVANRLGLSFTITPALLEFDCGMMEGRGDDEAWRAHHAVIQAWDMEDDYDRFIPPDGESYNDMKARFLPFVDELRAAAESRGAVLLISHGSILHQMLPLILSNVDRGFTRRNRLGNCELVITQKAGSQWECQAWGDLTF